MKIYGGGRDVGGYELYFWILEFLAYFGAACAAPGLLHSPPAEGSAIQFFGCLAAAVVMPVFCAILRIANERR